MNRQSQPTTVTVHVPMKFTLRGGRKVIISEVAETPLPPQRSADALLKALAKAFRWRKQIESGEYGSITELAKSQGVNDSYACRMLRLTLLSPKFVSSILDCRQPVSLTLKNLSKPIPVEWSQQWALLGVERF